MGEGRAQSIHRLHPLELSSDHLLISWRGRVMESDMAVPLAGQITCRGEKSIGRSQRMMRSALQVAKMVADVCGYSTHPSRRIMSPERYR